MNILKANLFLILLSIVTISHASVPQAAIMKLKNSCVSEGEEPKVCECVADKWASAVLPQEVETAKAMIALMADKRQPNPSQMASLQPLIMRYTQIGMSCASLEYPQEPEAPEDIASLLPQGSMTAEQIEAFNGIINSQNSAGANRNINKLATIEQEQRSARRDQKKATQQEQDTVIANLREQYNIEKQKFIGKPLSSLPLSEFENLFKLNFQLRTDESQDTITCLWKVLKQSVGSGPAASLATYFIASDSGAYDLEDEYKPHAKEAQLKQNTYYSNRQTCF